MSGRACVSAEVVARRTPRHNLSKVGLVLYSSYVHLTGILPLALSKTMWLQLILPQYLRTPKAHLI